MEKIVKKMFPDVCERIRLQGYSEGYRVGFNNGKTEGNIDGLIASKKNGVRIDKYGITVVKKRNKI